MKQRFVSILLLAGLLVIVYQTGIKTDRVLQDEKEVKTENMVLNADSEMPQEEAWETVGAEEEVTAKSRPWERTPVRYTGEYSDTMGILDSENTIFYQDFYKDYHFPYPRGINYFIAVCPQDSLEDYFNQAYLYASGEPSSELNRKDIYCMFYDDRTCNMGKEELEILFLQNGYELSICEGACKGYQVRFYQYGVKDSDRLLYPRHIIMQTWDDENVYVQDITSDMQRKVMSFISVDDRENPLIIVHSTAMTREGVPEEELLFWEFDGNCWLLVPLELEIECFMKTARGKTEPGRIEDFNPIYYKDGIVFRTAVCVEDENGIVSYLKLCDMREINKNKTFQFALCEESYHGWNYLISNDGWVNFEIK